MSARSALAAVLCIAVLAGCSANPDLPMPGQPTSSSQPSPLTLEAPTGGYQVIEERINLELEEYRLSGVLYYPQAKDATFPVVIFGHGLRGMPDNYAALLRGWAAAGFVVAAPVFPETNAAVKEISPSAVAAQAQYVSVMLDYIGSVDAAEGIGAVADVKRAAVAGHSAGGITALSVLNDEGQQGRDERFKAGIVLGGSAEGVGDTFIGDPASLLFVHAKGDSVVSYEAAQAAYAAVPWPKAFLALPGGEHTSPFASADDKQFPLVAAVTLDFLRWSLYSDTSAKDRLAGKVTIEN